MVSAPFSATPVSAAQTVAAPSVAAPPPPRWLRPAAVATGLFSAATVAVGVLEARLPVGPGNVDSHHRYPFLVVVMAACLMAAAFRTARYSRRWAALAAVAGLGYAINGLLVAAVSYAVTPEGAWLPATPIGWVEHWFFLIPDVGFFGLAVGVLPGYGLGRLRRVLAGLLVGVAVGVGVARAVVLPGIENTTYPNPLAIRALAPLAGAVEAATGVTFLLGVLLSVGSGIAVAVRSRREHRGAGLPAVLAGVAVLVTFVLQTLDAPLDSAGLAAGGLAIAVLCVRVVRAFAPSQAAH